MEKYIKGKRPVLTAFIIYTTVALITVLSAWITGLRRYDLSITISRYVALRPWTAVLYAISIVVLVALILIYVKRTEMPVYRKIIYFLIFMCVLAVGLCPFNREWSSLVSDIHNYSAYALMVFTTVSFLLLLIKGCKAQKIFAVIALVYAAFFIVSFVVIDWPAFANTIFIWEMTFIYLLLAELALE